MAHRPLFAASRWLPCVVAALTAACGGETARGPDTDVVPGPSGPHESPPGGTAVTLQLPQALRAELDSLRAAQAEVKGLTPDGFAARYPVSHVQSLGYDPTQAKGLDLIQASNLGLSADELAGVATNGFVLSKARRFPTFAYGYASLYADDLPLYISADSILDAVHRSFDKVLQQTELNVLIPELGALLRDLRARLAVAESLDRGVRADVDVYLAVALGLLSGAPAAPAAGGDPGAIASLVDAATKASGGIQKIKLFGVPREVDVSQFKPRGHYTDSEELSAYFRAMMWLGRIDFRLIETKETGEQVFHRRQLDAMLALHSLFDTGSIERHRAIDSAIETFVGESDNMKVSEVASLLADLGAAPGAPTVTASDADIAQRLLDGGYGAQRIASDLMINATADGSPLPLHRTFLVFGQRYTVDSHVFSNVVFDRVAGRMMPDPLDAAFAALGNDQAGALLAPELSRYPYAPALASMRILVDAHEPAYWESTLYTTWLSALRALSPGETTGDPASLGLPLVTGTEPWGRRILNTQLGSWAQLRHDTIL
ncbi:MAG: DUF3160 domain-containing protein, partial [Deltaproteobacteria bacterium]|nr:DUF3160 domain-containing protein [Deltaproteobacteria bacterium]